MLAIKILASSIRRQFVRLGGCFGSYYESPTPINVNQTMLQKGKPHHVTNLSDKDFWTSSSSEELASYSHCQTSQRSCSSSLSTETQVLSDTASDTSLVQYGPALWSAGRKEWLGNRTKSRRTSQEPVINWTESYNDLLGTRNPFAERIPLPEMVDFLVDIWEQEGLYD